MDRRIGTIVATLVALTMFAPTAWAPAPPDGLDSLAAEPGASTLLVSLEEATCLLALADGTILSGHEGGGVAEWGPNASLLALATTVEGLPSAHIQDLADWNGTAFAATRAGVAVRSAPGHWKTVSNMSTESLGAGTRGLIGVDKEGVVLESRDGATWSPVQIRGDGIEGIAWRVAVWSGDILAVTNGVGIVVMDLAIQTNASVLVPLGGSSPGVGDLAIEGMTLAVTFGDRPDVFNLSSDEWLDPSVAASARRYANNWSCIAVDEGIVMAGASGTDGNVVELEPAEGTTPASWALVARVQDGGTVSDVAPRAAGGAHAAMDSGAWTLPAGGPPARLGEGTTSTPRSNYIDGVEIAGNVLWATSLGHLYGLELTSDGAPISWSLLPPEGFGLAIFLRDSAEYNGVVYLAIHSEVWTYDLYLSSKPSRWGKVPLEGVMAGGRAQALEISDGRLWCGGSFGLAWLVQVGNASRWELETGSPKRVFDLAAVDDGLLAATDSGPWMRNGRTGTWTEGTGPGAAWLPEVPLTCLAGSAGGPWAGTIQGIFWKGPPNGTFPAQSTVTDICALASGRGAIWASLHDNRAIAIVPPSGEGRYFGSGEPGSVAVDVALGDALVKDVAIGPEGTAFLATDSGVHRVDPFNNEWAQWTTTEGLSANDLRTLQVEPGTDRLWIGAYGGVDVLDTATGGISSISTDQGLPSNLVYQIIAREGEAWVGTDAGGAARRPFSGGTWQAYNMTTGLVADDVQAIAALGTKVIFGTDSGVTVLDLTSSAVNSYTMSSTAGRLPGDWVWCELAVGARVWVGTDRGLAWLDPATGDFSFQAITDLDQPAVRSLAQDRTGRLWVGTDAGVFVLNVSLGEVEARLDHTGGLPGDEALALMPDSTGSMWVGTSAGAALVDEQARVIATYTTRDGLAHDRVTCLAEHPDGTVWIGTAGGLSMLERTRWAVLPQWSTAVQDLPDVAISQEGVRVTPKLPSEGDEVTFNVTVTNPSHINAIATIALMSDDGGQPGLVLDTAIAYTVAGGCYTVLLKWTAVGGEVPLWIVADPDGRVPESDRRNNQVAFGLHVNHRPVLLDATYHLENASDVWEFGLRQSGTFRVNVTYRDIDGDLPVEVRVGRDLPTDAGFNMSHGWMMPPVVPAGSVLTGRLYSGVAYLGSGNNTLYIATSDGPSVNWTSITIPFNFNISISGIAPGSRVSGHVRIGFGVTGPREGTGVANLSAWYPYNDTRLQAPGFRMIEAERDGMNLTLNLRTIDVGTHDIWFVAFDDRGMFATSVVQGVVVEQPEEQGTSGNILVVILLLVVACSIMVSALKIRSTGGGPG
jgi:ligand-binding sensor domain-containing protein